MGSPDESARFDPSAAEEHLRRAHEINGEETGPMLRLGEIMIVKGDMAAARHWLEAAARTNPKSVEAAFLAGYLRWQEGNLDDARAFYAKAVRAARIDAPVKGVLNEGDRKASPLRLPMGRTLFGSFCATLPESATDLGPLYQPVRDYARRLAHRTQRRSS
ncbi:MAG TPA: tetratricopeptide repeat protein [Patescibacteria group bacterium]|nr:tetratricopeptide repeat protein [Patescibacteria group bacterium]